MLSIRRNPVVLISLMKIVQCYKYSFYIMKISPLKISPSRGFDEYFADKTFKFPEKFFINIISF